MVFVDDSLQNDSFHLSCTSTLNICEGNYLKYQESDPYIDELDVIVINSTSPDYNDDLERTLLKNL